MTELRTNVLYYGDNLDILRKHIPEESIDLVYLDPPFNSQATYNVLFKEPTGELSAAQLRAFSDTWHWDLTAEQTFKEMVEKGPPQVARMIAALREFIGRNDMMAYLVMMTVRLVELRRVLKPTGSLYLHCDPTASHYLKIVLDTIFGARNFRNEIVWRRTGSHHQARRYGPIHDTIMFYSKTDQYRFQPVYRPYLKGHVENYFKKQNGKGRYWSNALTGAGTRTGESGRPWREFDPTVRGRHWAIPGELCRDLGIPDDLSVQEKLDALYAKGVIDLPPPGSTAMPTYKQYLNSAPGIPLQDIWAYQPHTKGVLYDTDEGIDEDVRWLTRQGDPERLGYATQKPLALLERIIQASSNTGDLVLDPFCGCGTAVVAAHKLGRRWIGIDITHLAITVMKKRLEDSFDLLPGRDYQVVGEPVDLAGARALAGQDRYQFQWWALSLVGASPVGDDHKKGADRGLDGVIGFMEQGGKAKRVIVQVKSGHVNAPQVRDLKGTMEREKAELGLFITLEPPTAPMRKEAVSAGFYHSELWKEDYPRVQVCTIEDLLAGKLPTLLRHAYGGFARAERIRREEGKQGAML